MARNTYDWEENGWRERDNERGSRYYQDYDWEYSTPYRGAGYDRRYTRRDEDQGRRRSFRSDYDRGRRFASPYDYTDDRRRGESDSDYQYGYRDDSTYDFDRGSEMAYGVSNISCPRWESPITIGETSVSSVVGSKVGVSVAVLVTCVS